MQNLTKENFFNEMMALCPEAVEYFCRWIDEYKKEVNWDKLFPPPRDPRIHGVKFHDLPFEMQNGIIARFELELFNNKGGHGKGLTEEIQQAYRGQLRKIFYDLQKSMEARAQKLN